MSMEAWATPVSALPENASGRRPYEPLATPAAPAVGRVDLLGGDIPFRPMAVSEMLDGAIAGIRRNIRVVLGLSLIITAVVQVLLSTGSYLFIGEGARDELTPIALQRSFGAQATLGAIGMVMSAFGILLLAGFLSPVVGRMMFGQPPVRLRQVWRDVRPRLARLVGTATLVMAVSLLALTIPVIPFVLFIAAEAPVGLAVLSGIVGIPLALALTIWLYVLYVLAVPALVFERQGVIRSMRRASQLSRGRWWRTCGTLVLALLITFFMGFFAIRVPFLFVEAIAFGDDPTGAGLLLALTIDTAGRIVSWTLISPFDAGVIALIYVDRRMRREGFDLEVLTGPGAGRGTPAVASDTTEAFFELWRPSPLVPPPGTPSMRAPAPPHGLLDHMRPGVVVFPSAPPGVPAPPPGAPMPPPGAPMPPPGPPRRPPGMPPGGYGEWAR